MTKTDEVRSQIISSIELPLEHQYVMLQGNRQIEIFWLVEAAEAIAILYNGYQLGNKIDEIGSAIARTIDAVGDIARSVAKIIDKLSVLIDAINHFIEAVGRKVDEAFCRQHMADIESATVNIIANVSTLKTKPNDAADPEVIELLRNLRTYQDDLFKAIVRYLRQEGSPPTPAALITCAPAIATFAQAYTIQQMYKPVEQRVGVWGTVYHDYFVNMFGYEFNYIRDETPRINQALKDLNIPGNREVMDFDGARFYPTKIPYGNSYPFEPRYSELFTSVDSYFPNRIKATRHDRTLSGQHIYNWQMFDVLGDYPFANPQRVEAADKLFSQRYPLRQLYLRFLADGNVFLQLENKISNALVKPPGW